jgi:hypothetical protein
MEFLFCPKMKKGFIAKKTTPKIKFLIPSIVSYFNFLPNGID